MSDFKKYLKDFHGDVCYPLKLNMFLVYCHLKDLALLTMMPEISLAGVYGECMLSIGGSGPIYNAIYRVAQKERNGILPLIKI